MNIRQAKERIRISDFLARTGHQPAYTKGGEYWYNSMLPGRQDDTPSFKTDPTDRLWIDQGTRKGGTIIELAMILFDCDESGALHTLSNLYPGDLFDTPPTVQARSSSVKRPSEPEGLPLFEHQATAPQGVAGERTGVEVLPITSRGLYWYLHHRGIDPKLAKPYVQELRYQANGRPFYALAFASDEGGYELRNGVGVTEGGPGFKGAHGPKAITVLHSEKARAGGSVTVFEGFFDFLSALAYFGKSEPDTPVIVMNSTSMHAQALEAITHLDVAKVYLYLDRDATGREATETIRAQLPGMTVEDRSTLYAEHADFNDFWKAHRQRLNAAVHPVGA